jgi:hypothetical protein
MTMTPSAEFRLTSTDGVRVACGRWNGRGSVRGVVVSRLCDPVSLGKIRPDLPIYLFSGSEDPVGQQLDGVRVLIERCQSAGVTGISHDFYPGGRHEMLNETNRDEVRTRLIGWISSVREHRKLYTGAS